MSSERDDENGRGGRRQRSRRRGPSLADFERAARQWTDGDSLAVVTIGISGAGPVVVGMANSAGQHMTTVGSLRDLMAALTDAQRQSDARDRDDDAAAPLPAPGDRGGWH
jgi:hypothetical protein